MSELEDKIRDLQEELGRLRDRVRLRAVAEEFLAGAVKWREGDVFVSDGILHQITDISSDGRWTVISSGGYGGGFQPHMSGEVYYRHASRLFTRAEVAEILGESAE